MVGLAVSVSTWFPIPTPLCYLFACLADLALFIGSNSYFILHRHVYPIGMPISACNGKTQSPASRYHRHYLGFAALIHRAGFLSGKARAPDLRTESNAPVSQGVRPIGIDRPVGIQKRVEPGKGDYRLSSNTRKKEV